MEKLKENSEIIMIILVFLTLMVTIGGFKIKPLYNIIKNCILKRRIKNCIKNAEIKKKEFSLIMRINNSTCKDIFIYNIYLNINGKSKRKMNVNSVPYQNLINKQIVPIRPDNTEEWQYLESLCRSDIKIEEMNFDTFIKVEYYYMDFNNQKETNKVIIYGKDFILNL